MATVINLAGQQPTFKVVGGALHKIVAAAHQLLAMKAGGLFQYGGILCAPLRVPTTITHKDGRIIPEGTIELAPIGKEWLRLELCRLAKWQRASKDRKAKLEWYDCDAPMAVAAAVLADREHWRARVLTGISEIPILRRDGSIFDRPGYDPETGLLYDPNGHTFPPLPAKPTSDDAKAALELLKEPLLEFPFVKECHRSAALALILTAIIRRTLPTAPAFGLDAREAGTGKMLLANVAAIIATGRIVPITPFTEDEDEQRKRITASLLAGHPIICIDNVTTPVEGAALSALLTSETWRERILGISKDATVPSNALVVMTGNNLTIMGDMTRRALPIQLDARCERPELRRFKRALLPWLHENRPQLVTAALTVLAAWRHAGRPDQNLTPLGSFEQWTAEIANCLVWLDQPNPLEAMDQTRAQDPRRALLRRILATWFDLWGNAELTLGTVLKEVEENCTSANVTEERRELYQDLANALDEADPNSRTPQARRVRIGTYLSANDGRVVAIKTPTMTLQLKRGSIVHKVLKWRVNNLDAAAK